MRTRRVKTETLALVQSFARVRLRNPIHCLGILHVFSTEAKWDVVARWSWRNCYCVCRVLAGFTPSDTSRTVSVGITMQCTGATKPVVLKSTITRRGPVMADVRRVEARP